MKKNYLLISFLLFSFVFYGQENGYLEFSGRCVKDNQPLKGAVVSIYKGSTKVSDITTPKNGKFQFFLPFGVDYRINFTYPNCPDMYLIIYSSKCDEKKEIFPIYDIDVNYFEYGKPTINYANFKNPFTKIVYDGKKSFRDDETYAADFLQNLYIDPDEIRKRDEQLAIEKHKKELEAKMKLEAEDKQRLEQLADAQKKSQEEADHLKKQLEDKSRQEKQNEAKNGISDKEADSKESMVSEEVELTLEKEKRNIKEKQNRAIKAVYETDLLKIVATNQRKSKEAEYVKKKSDATRNEVIETLQKEAETKAKTEQVVFDSKIRNKQATFNSRIKNQEVLALIKQTAYSDRDHRSGSVKKFPDTKNYKPPGLVGISTDMEQSAFKSVYTITISNGNQKTIFRKEKFSWGLIYYYKNDKEIKEEQYLQEVSLYNIAL